MERIRTEEAFEPAGQLPPQNLEAEKAVLGMMMLDRSSIEDIIKVLGDKSEHFYHPAHRKIYAAILDLERRNIAPDILSVSDALRNDTSMESVGGLGYLTSLSESGHVAAHAPHYAQIVREKSLLRHLISTASDIIKASYASKGAAEQVLDQAEQKVFEIASMHQVDKPFQIKERLPSAMEWINTISRRKEGELPGVACGFTDIDNITGGFHPSNLILLGGRPSMGKTTLGLNIAEHVAIKLKKPVLFCTLEMSWMEITQRMLCSLAQVPGSEIRTGRIPREYMSRLGTAAGLLHESLIWIYESGNVTPLELRGIARRLKAQHSLSLIVIDYLQLMPGKTGRADVRQQEVADISRSLKILAKDLDVPVLALSQLNRGPEKESKERAPRLSDLRESGALEQDADLVLLLHRPNMFNKDTEEEAGLGNFSPGGPPQPPGVEAVKLVIAKNRHGPTRDVDLVFRPHLSRFENAAKGTA